MPSGARRTRPRPPPQRRRPLHAAYGRNRSRCGRWRGRSGSSCRRRSRSTSSRRLLAAFRPTDRPLVCSSRNLTCRLALRELTSRHLVLNVLAAATKGALRPCSAYPPEWGRTVFGRSRGTPRRRCPQTPRPSPSQGTKGSRADGQFPSGQNCEAQRAPHIRGMCRAVPSTQTSARRAGTAYVELPEHPPRLTASVVGKLL